MSRELLAGLVLHVLDPEPVIARWQRVAVVGTVPTGAQRADLLQQLPETVKYINFCRRVATGDPDDVPGVVETVLVGRHKPRVINDAHLFGHAAATVHVTDRNRVRAGLHARKDVALLEGAVVQLVLVLALPGGRDLYHVLAVKGIARNIHGVLLGWRGKDDRGSCNRAATGLHVRHPDLVAPALKGNDGGFHRVGLQHPVDGPCEYIERGVQARIDQRRGWVPILLGDRNAVVNAQAVLFLQLHHRGLHHAQQHLHHGEARVPVSRVGLVGHTGIDDLWVHNVVVYVRQRVGARFRVLKGLMVGQHVDCRVLTVQDFIAQGVSLSIQVRRVGRVADQGEGTHTVVLPKIVAYLVRQRGRIGRSGLLDLPRSKLRLASPVTGSSSLALKQPVPLSVTLTKIGCGFHRVWKGGWIQYRSNARLGIR